MVTPLSVIYAEDDPFTRALYQEMLGEHFSDVRLAASGHEAMLLYRQRPCGLLLTDLFMPDMNGLELCRKLRGYDPELPLVIISSHDEGELVLETANLGIDGYLLKPVTPGLLQHTLGRVTERRAARHQVLQASRAWSAAFDAIPDMIAVLDLNYCVVQLNRTAQDLLGCSQEAAVGRDYCAMLHPGGVLPKRCLRQRQTGSCCMKAGTDPVAMLGGYFNVTVTPVIGEEHEKIGTVHVARNVTAKALADRELARSEARYRMLLNSGYDAIFVHGIDQDFQPGSFTEVNDAACRMFGYSREELMLCGPCDLHAPQTACNESRFIEELLESGSLLQEVEVARKDGTTFFAELSSHLFYLDNRHQVLSILRDCSERKRQEERLRYISTHDQLTGLYNRSWFETELARLCCGRIWPISFIAADLNELKTVNDQLGHAAGDELLCRVANVLQQCCRADEMIARVGGDEFVVMLPGIDASGADAIIDRIRRQVAQQGSILPRLSLAIGTATAVTNEQVVEVLSLADQRMYRDKAAMKSDSHLFS